MHIAQAYPQVHAVRLHASSRPDAFFEIESAQMASIVLASAFIPGFESTQSELFATVQLAVRLRNGVLEMPPGIKHLFVEVGIGEFYGFNATILAYGQTGSGKTYTMMGGEKAPGVVLLTVDADLASRLAALQKALGGESLAGRAGAWLSRPWGWRAPR